jgi:two-component system, chemotaxis family, CheB/CheR fusion protein
MPRRKSQSTPAKSKARAPVNPGVNEVVEHTTPERSLPFPIVAIGASAGGIEACSALLEALPADTGMAFVVVQHLSPEHESVLPEILSRATRMRVTAIKGEMPVEPDHVYVIPPNKSLAFGHGMLRPAPRAALRGQARPIDHFMRSLAEEHGHKAIGIVLSGTATDGTLGLEEIKAGGGITFAQDSTAGQSGMPRSAIDSGMVDFVLPPQDIARELERIARHPFVAPADVDPPAQEPAFSEVLDALRHSTGVDFSDYKRNTLYRRITRRMVLHKLHGLREYVSFLQAHPGEVQSLYQDVLINVTSFFRNPEAYEALKTTVFPKLAEGRERNEPVRVWALGCSTGEEAYSLAMAYIEYAERAGKRAPMQVFAADVNGQGIERARAGVYPKGIVQDVSPERLRRFFNEVDGGYRIAKPIRDMVVFARQNALTDPPFSQLDLIACRNMLIYLEPVLQQRLIPLFHYALRQDGYLWLGASETIGTYRDLFDLTDARNKIYARKPGKHTPRLDAPKGGWRLSGVPAVAKRIVLPREGIGPDPLKEADRLVLMRYAPPGVLLNEDFEVLQFRGETGAYLSPSPGRASLNLLKMLREGLLVAVRGALHRVRREKATTREEGLRVRSDGGWREVDVVVMPVRSGAPAEGAYLVLFEEPAHRIEARAHALAAETRAAAQKVAPSHDESSQQEMARLKQELAATREYLQSVIEQQESANEELQSANEEVQSSNEELQSINEELETSKEEIESTNEELATVNDELQARNIELSQTNNDLVNLLASVSMAIVMLGPDLRIRRFTQPAERLLNLIPADVGRPISDIQFNIGIPALETMVAEVIDTGATREREVRDPDGRWFLLRVRPYRTAENKIEGAVVILVDIDNLKRAEQSMRESEQRFAVLADSAPVLIWVDDLAGCRFVNHAFEEFVGEPESEIRRLGEAAFVHPDERRAFVQSYDDAVRGKREFQMRARMRRADGAYRWMKMVAIPRFVAPDQLGGFVGCGFDITDIADAEAALVELDRGKNEFLAMLAHELRNPLSGVRNALRLFSESADTAVVSQARDIIDRQTVNMMRMIEDLLDVSRITYGKIQLRPEPVDLRELLERAVRSSDDERNALKQTIKARLPAGPLVVKGDPVRLDQIFTNLLANASKFTREGGHIWLTVEREAFGPDARPTVTVRVRDDGVGIDPEILPRIFELFVQADRGTERARSGIGLGLTLAKRLVELHGGTIEAKSAGNGLGSEFVVRLPAAGGPSAAAVEPRRDKSVQDASRRVLIVDDDRDSGESLKMVFSISGHAVQLIARGADAVPAAAEFRPDLIVLDIGLPDLDGYQVARNLRADPRTAKVAIVAVTGFGRDTDRARSRQAGIDFHMTKPVDHDALMEFLRANHGRREI